MAIFEQMKEKVSIAALSIGNKARHGAEIARIAGEKRVIAGEIRRHYEELGRTIYESQGRDMDTCREICEKIDQKKARLEALTARNVILCNQNRCPECGAVMNRRAKFCSACGAAMPESVEKKDEPVQEKPEE